MRQALKVIAVPVCSLTNPMGAYKWGAPKMLPATRNTTPNAFVQGAALGRHCFGLLHPEAANITASGLTLT